MRHLLLSAALAASPLALAAPLSSSNQSCTTLTAAEIQSMGNNTLFTRWRPYSHFNAPAGWMNDPCGAMYDPTRDIYHLFYQWHPEHVNWGNISWGHAVSQDLITWTDVTSWQGRDALALGPTGYGNYNGLGIFSGTAQPVNLSGQVDGTILAFYTSVAHLPTAWDIYYQPYTETQSLAISTDGGKTFSNYEGNPVIRATTETAPMYWNITGFRDPFLEPFPALDEVLQVSEPHYYAVFGSGIKGVGPRMPLWTAPSSNLTDWSFLGALWEPAKNTSLGPLLSTRTYGFNFEVSGFFALPDSTGQLHYFINMGAEGGNLTYEPQSHVGLWNQGLVTRRSNGSAQFEPIAGGMADWGIGYALTSFNDTKNNRRVQYGWVQEDISGDGGIFSANQQGFQGSHTLPRQLYVHEQKNVVDPSGVLSASKSAVLTSQGNGTFLAQTLGIKPLKNVVKGLQKGSKSHSHKFKTYNNTTMLSTSGASSLQIKARFTKASGAFGLVVGASPDMTEYTTITYQPTNHTLLVNRDHSSLIDEFQNYTVTGYFYPYTIQSSNGTTSTEPVQFNVFLDGSLLEVYVNNRFAMSTRIYPSMSCSTGYGIYIETGSTADVSAQAWEGLKYIWTDRPMNSSSMLVWDTAAQTDNYTWWTGN